MAVRWWKPQLRMQFWRLVGPPSARGMIRKVAHLIKVEELG